MPKPFPYPIPLELAPCAVPYYKRIIRQLGRSDERISITAQTVAIILARLERGRADHDEFDRMHRDLDRLGLKVEQVSDHPNAQRLA